MKNAVHWKPTKFVRTRQGLKSSRNLAHVSRESRFITDIVAEHYDRAIRAHAGGRLLDMGCGHVPLYDVYRELVQENVCIDWGNTIHANSHLDYTVDLNGKLPFDDSCFDSVVLTDVLEHIVEPVIAMCEIARILRPGGKLIAGVPFFYRLHEQPHDYYRYTEFALRHFCKLGGLTVVSLDSYGGLPEVLFDLSSRVVELLPRPLARVLRPLHAIISPLCKRSPLSKLSEWSRQSFPLGYVLVAQRPLAGEC